MFAARFLNRLSSVGLVPSPGRRAKEKRLLAYVQHLRFSPQLLVLANFGYILGALYKETPFSNLLDPAAPGKKSVGAQPKGQACPAVNV